MDILRLDSKVKLGCNMCDKCCVYRGDIKITPYNACEISKYLGITLKEFLNTYTDIEDNGIEVVLKTEGNLKQCILYDENIKGCGIHVVKPMQCVMFPLIPESLKNDYFINSEQCMIEEAKEITVNDWLNGNNKRYYNLKNICIEWITFLDWILPKLKGKSKENIEKIYKILFEEYDFHKNLKKQMIKKMDRACKEIKKYNININ